MIIKEHRCTRIPLPLRVFELIIQHNLLYPIVCIGVRRAARSSVQFALELVDLNEPGETTNGESNAADSNGEATTAAAAKSTADSSSSAGELLNATCVRQIAPDTLLICVDCGLIRQSKSIICAATIFITTLAGQVRHWVSNDGAADSPAKPPPIPCRLDFPFRVESLVCLSDSVLALHRHGVHGRSLADGATTQDLHDTAHVYRMLGSDK